MTADQVQRWCNGTGQPSMWPALLPLLQPALIAAPIASACLEQHIRAPRPRGLEVDESAQVVGKAAEGARPVGLLQRNNNNNNMFPNLSGGSSSRRVRRFCGLNDHGALQRHPSAAAAAVSGTGRPPAAGHEAVGRLAQRLLASVEQDDQWGEELGQGGAGRRGPKSWRSAAATAAHMQCPNCN